VEAGQTAAAELLAAHPEITAVVCTSDILALGALRRRGARATVVGQPGDGDHGDGDHGDGDHGHGDHGHGDHGHGDHGHGDHGRGPVRLRCTATFESMDEAARELLRVAREGAAFPKRPKFILGPEGRGWLARAEAEFRRASGDNDPAEWEAAIQALSASYEKPRPADRTRKLTAPSRMLTSVPSLMASSVVAGAQLPQPLGHQRSL